MIFKQIPTAIKDLNQLGAALNSLSALKMGTVDINTENIQLYRNAIQGLSTEQAVFALSTKGATSEQIKEIMLTEAAAGAKVAYKEADIQAALAKNGLATASTVLTAKQKEEIINSGLVTSKKMEEIASVLGLEAAEGGALVSKEALNAATVSEQLTSIGVTGSTQAQILSILGLTTAEGAAVVGTNLLTAAFQKLKQAIMSNPYLFIIGAVLAGCIAIYNAIKKHSEKIEEQKKKIKEAAEEAKSAINNIKSEFENLSSSTNGIKERFAELAQGVSNLGKMNQSRGKLSTEDYEEFLGLSNQLAELFPQLQIGLDDNGNSILSLSGNVDTIVGSLNNLVSVQQKLANQQIIEEIPDVWKQYNADLSDYNNAIKKTQTSILNYKKAFSQILNGKVVIDDDNVNNAIIYGLEQIGIKAASNYSGNYDGLYEFNVRPGEFINAEWDFSILEDTQIEMLKEKLASLIKEYEDTMQMTKSKMAAANSEMTSYINTWLSGEWMYLSIDNSDIKNLAKDVLLSSDWMNNLPDSIKGNDWEEVKNWLQNDLLYAIDNIDDKEIQTALANVLNGEFTVESLQETINQLSEAYGFDSNNPLIIYLQAKLDDRTKQINDIKAKLNNDLNEEELNNRIKELTPEDLQIAAELVDVSDGTLLSWDELITKINEYKTSASDIPLLSFSDFFNSADFSDTAQELLALAKSGEITPEVLESTEKYKMLLDKTGDTAEEATNKILNLLSGQEKLAGASNGLDPLQSAYEEFIELGFVTAGTLESLPDYFKKLDSFDRFSKIVSSPTQDEEKIQQAFNDIVTHYLVLQDTLSGVIGASESNIQRYIANLKEMNITNAEELVTSLKSLYKSDYDNWCDLIVEKEKAYSDFTEALEGISSANWTTRLGKDLSPELQEKADNKNLNYADALLITQNYHDAHELLKKQELSIKKDAALEAKKNELKLKYGTDTDFSALYNPQDSSSASSTDSSQSFDWLETKITRTNEALDRLDRKTSDTYASWSERNDALTQSVNKTKEAIELQRQAYNAYMKEADSVGLSEHYKKLVQNGALSIEDVDDSNIADRISEYQDLYEKAISCSDTVAELEQSLNELSFNTRWENIKTELDAVVSIFDADIDLIQTKIDSLEIRGLFANSSYYTEMSSLTQKKLSTLKSEATQLKSILSAMPQDGEGYDSLLSELMDINKEIAELENNCIEFNNNIRDLDWEIFEYLEESINRITDETEYLIGLLENENLFDENGNFTQYADAALGLHSAAYEAYKRQAQDYYDEVRELQKQLVDGAGQEVLDHYNEIVDAHRDAVSAAESEKQAILDLIEDGYDAQLDAIQKLIDKKKEQLDTEKNLYDYRKSIAEKTANISSLEKQMLAYKDDDSEESMSRIQKLKVELEEAKADLAETEYEQYLQDTEDMLDKLSEDYESWINARLDDEDALLSDIVGTIADKGDKINATLNEIADKNNTLISDSIRSIFDADQPFAAVMNGIRDAVTGVGAAVSDLQNSIAGMTGADRNTNASSQSPSGIQSDKTTITSGGESGTNAPSPVNSSGKTGSDSSDGGSWGSWFVKKKDAYSKNKLNKDTSIVDRLKFFDIDPDFAKRASYYKAMGGSGSYISSAAQNVWMLNQMKAHGYKNGTSGAAGGWHWTQENGGEIILRKSDGAMFMPLNKGDMVFSNESSKRLYEFAENPEAFMKKYNIDTPFMSSANLRSAPDYRLPDLTGAARRSSSVPVNIGDINITCNEVNNARELMEDVTNHLIKNNRFGNAMSTMINNQIMGKNPLEHMKYVKH